MVFPAYADISIHAPREGGDEISSSGVCFFDVFQSTPPARGATIAFVRNRDKDKISIHAPREGGDEINDRQTFGHWISIHAPREGGDVYSELLTHCAVGISIHAPREGGDREPLTIRKQSNISIHAPREGGDS